MIAAHTFVSFFSLFPHPVCSYPGSSTGVGFLVADRGERKLESTTLAQNVARPATTASDIPMAGHENSSECIDVCDPVDLQCTPSMSRLLADLLDHGRTVFWREVLQVR